ncbi:putative F-box domain, FBD domain, leucine-rich repeat domain, L domain-containing protein [Rosa chinensis]|uniref:Putative F-box domain, FBD domain, leucine-rich repeat domain, L domain-containing protein n=1 Tax=Rosa chinensis TaxID=74649 RepID=A0A2P6QK11_ROSCH|nr:FBD-associated F-box protein At2g26860 [Rosa chinensis]XP_024160707.1 FBD-associated F-box protein At2g26860 [Rosa chinensis]PRQ34519.1 putative F-box domain, FBD domain, leucine-rich repeat domain, L domain-containing protein [Rosa chinensis]
MDASSQMLKPKRQKLDGGEENRDMEGGMKSLSNLPDVVLEKILSLLSTENAIRTSILSKRWEYLWTSIPTLNFFQGTLNKRTAMVNAVERALMLRRGVDIKKFTLCFEVLGDASLLNPWISAIVRLNVEELFLGLYSLNGPLCLPHSLFSSSILKDLQLDVPFIFKVPSTVCLSSLRSLTLRSVVFSDEYSTQQLFSGCPVLEKLSLHNCNWGNLKFVSICAPKLLRLIINESDLQISRDAGGCRIIVFGVSLTYFSYAGEFLNEYTFHSSSVNQAEINACPTKMWRHLSYRLYKLFRGLSSLKILTTCSYFFKVMLANVSELLAQMPLFNDLTTLVLDSVRVDLDCEGLLRMLQNCPCLQTLVFSEGISLSSGDANDDGVLDPLPPCFLTSLKEIKVYAFYGDEDEIYAVESLLKTAMVLEKVIVTFAKSLEGGPEEINDVGRQLSDFPKGSEICEIVLQY